MTLFSSRVALGALIGVVVLAGCEPPPVTTVQRGYRGTGMQEVYHPASVEKEIEKNQPPRSRHRRHRRTGRGPAPSTRTSRCWVT